MGLLLETPPQSRANVRAQEGDNKLPLERPAKDFADAIRQTVLGVLLSEANQHNDDSNGADADSMLTKLEQSVIERLEKAKINLLLDIDGVLVKTKQELVRFLKQLITGNFKDAKQTLKKNIPTSNARLFSKIIKLKNVKKTIITDRFLLPGNFKAFPFFSSDSKEKLQGLEVEVCPNFFKIFRSGTHFLEQIKNADLTYYIGSDLKDRILFERIQKAMKRNNIDSSKLIYIQVEHTFF